MLHLCGHGVGRSGDNVRHVAAGGKRGRIVLPGFAVHDRTADRPVLLDEPLAQREMFAARASCVCPRLLVGVRNDDAEPVDGAPPQTFLDDLLRMLLRREHAAVEAHLFEQGRFAAERSEKRRPAVFGRIHDGGVARGGANDRRMPLAVWRHGA